MYPDKIIFGLDLYTILLLAGCISAILFFRIFSGKIGMADKVYNLTILSGVIAMIGGYGFSVLFQALYNFLETGVFTIASDTGATFYGGLVGGAALFLGSYFLIGHFTCKNKENIKQFMLLSDAAACAISIAHCLGRVGCLMAGCCYGKETDSFIGIYMNGVKRVPVQLFEAIFLLLLFGFFTFRLLTKRTYNLSLYMMSYGVWRFFIEYLRDDNRGASFIPGLSPSQMTAVLMILGGIAVMIFTNMYVKKHKNDVPAEKTGETDENAEG